MQYHRIAVTNVNSVLLSKCMDSGTLVNSLHCGYILLKWDPKQEAIAME